MTNKESLFIKNEDELFMLMSILVSSDCVVDDNIRLDLLKIILNNYHILVSEGIIKGFDLPIASQEDRENYELLIQNIKHLMILQGLPMKENEKGELSIDKDSLLDQYKKGEINLDND